MACGVIAIEALILLLTVSNYAIRGNVYAEHIFLFSIREWQLCYKSRLAGSDCSGICNMY